MKLLNSPIDSFNYLERQIYVKRDDLLHPEFSGNKARKLAYFLEHDFPEIDTLISYGGIQSNLMYSLSALAKLKKWNFIYYCCKPSEIALLQKKGNLAGALANGMQIITVYSKLDDYVKNLNIHNNQLLIMQGGAQPEAMYGIKQLAEEIITWSAKESISSLSIFLPSGTGVSALYLQKYLPKFKVYTTNCVGSKEYLIQQWRDLELDGNLPIILPNHKYRFATPYTELLEIHQSIYKLSQIEFDLIYDPVGWKILADNLHQINSPILYIHCGGVIGNSTMRNRYDYSMA